MQCGASLQEKLNAEAVKINVLIPFCGYDSSNVALGQCLDFLYLFSREASDHGNDQMYTSQALTGSPNVPQMYMWIFSGYRTLKHVDPENRLSLPIGIPASNGMHQDWWDAPSGAPDGNADQAHHFAFYFAVGAGIDSWRLLYGGGDGGDDQMLVRTLKATLDYGAPPRQWSKNPGDYYLGILAFDLGKQWRDGPRYMGGDIELILSRNWRSAFLATGRGTTGLP